MKLVYLSSASIAACTVGLAALLVFALHGYDRVRAEQAEIARLLALQQRISDFSGASDSLLLYGADPGVWRSYLDQAGALRHDLERLTAQYPPAAQAARQVGIIVAAVEAALADPGAPGAHAPGAGGVGPLQLPPRARIIMNQIAGHGIALDTATEEALQARQQAIAREATRLAGAFAGAALLFGTLAVAAFTLIHRRISRPTRALAGAIDRIRAGDADARAPASGRDELADLGRAFNDLIDRRQRAAAELEAERAELAQRQRMLAESQRIGGIGSWRLIVAEGRLEWSDETYRLLGVSPATFEPTPEAFLAYVHPDDRDRLRDIRAAALRGQRHHDTEFRIIRADGELRHVHERAEPERDGSGGIAALAGTIQDVTERKLMEDHLNQYRHLVERSHELYAVVGRDYRYVLVNDAYARQHGRSRADAEGAHVAEILGWTLFKQTVKPALDRTLAGETCAFESELDDPAGGTRHVLVRYYPIDSPTDGTREVGVAIVDITERKLAERELSRLAYQDRLTRLPSRQGFVRAVNAELERSGWQPEAMVVMHDIARLRDINDAYGYTVGDGLLVRLGGRLRERAGDGAVVGRTGGDEFVVFLPQRSDRAPDQQRADLESVFATPLTLEQLSIEVSARHGYTRLGDRCRDAETLLHEAELALFHGRDDPGGRDWTAYSAELDEHARQRVQLTGELKTALEQGEFELHFQPKVELGSGALRGCEALLRWYHPERGLQSPADFIPVAERSQLIAPIGDWVIEEACRRLRTWQDAGLDIVRVAVNVSLVQFAVGDFVETVRSALADHGVAPEALTLEVTESVFERESGALRRQLRALHGMGVRLALDDFGTGYSSLLYLQRYPFDDIKIDQGFVRHMLDDDYSRNLVAMVVGLAGALGAEPVAEGVESAEVRDALLALGCHHGQGYYYSMPVAAEDFRWLLDRHPRLPVPATSAA